MFDFKVILFFVKRIQIPIKANIRKTDRNVKDNVIFVVRCSATESVRGSVVVRNGLIALRYLKLGKPISPEFKIPILDITIEIKNIIQLRILTLGLLNFFIISDTTTKIVGKMIASAAKLMKNVVVLSKINDDRINDAAKIGAAHNAKFCSDFKNGNVK